MRGPRESETTGGYVWFVGAGPGDPEYITLRGWRVLQAADVVLHDALVNPALLAETQARLIDVGKRCGQHSMAQTEISDLLVTLALEGKRVVRLKGGDASVLGRVGEEALALAEADLAFEIVPGVSSATSVPSIAGIPVTHRGLADSFLVTTAHHQDEGTAVSIPPYSASTTVVLLMARGTALAWQRQLLCQGYPPDLPVALISRGSTPDARVIETTVSRAVDDLEQASLKTPLMVVVGWVVTLRSRLVSSMGTAPPLPAWPDVWVGQQIALEPPDERASTIQRAFRPVAVGVTPVEIQERP